MTTPQPAPAIDAHDGDDRRDAERKKTKTDEAKAAEPAKSGAMRKADVSNGESPAP